MGIKTWESATWKLAALEFTDAAFAAASSFECGKRFQDQHLDKLQQWVVGGVDALEGGYPYQVSFERFTGYNYHVCGATIVDSEWIITAAHCISAGNDGGNYNVVVGRQSISTFVPPGPKTKRYAIKKIIVHPKFPGRESYKYNDDIALVQVKETIEFNEFVQPACLPDDVSADPSSLYKPGTTALLSGWGQTKAKLSDGDVPNKMSLTLQAAALPLVDWKTCKAANILYDYMVTETAICAGYMEGGVDACQGDSGGPLVEIVNGKATLIGIVSGGRGCAWPDYPGIYTNVAYELDWIRSHIGR